MDNYGDANRANKINNIFIRYYSTRLRQQDIVHACNVELILI